MTTKKNPKANTEKAARYEIGTKVRVVDMPYLLYSRTQLYVRGVVGTIVAHTYVGLIPEDEAYNVDGKVEQYYIVRFRQQDLWPEYPFANDTLQTESPHRWLEPVAG